MITSFSTGRSIILGIAFASLVLFGTGCTSTRNQENPGLGAAGGAGSALAAAGFKYVASQALEQQCDQGQAAACKIAFALDPAYKNGKTQEEIKNILDSMDAKLNEINNKLGYIAHQLDQLASDLKIAVADLKLDSANNVAKPYMLPVINAYNAFQGLDYSNNNIPPTSLIVSSIMTNATSSNPYDVPLNMENLNGLIVDDVVGPGLLSKMDDLLKEKIDAIWKSGRPPSSDEAIGHYEVMEQYFGYLLMQQAKGLVVISASYKYLSKFPDATIPGSGSTILSHLLYKNFDDYSAYYNKTMEKQIRTFLKHVENYVAYTADVDKPGFDGSNTDIKSWVSVVLKRADLMAAWARASLKQDSGTAGTPILLVVRVMGEPDRSKLLYSSGEVRDGDAQTGIKYNVDKAFLKLATDQPEDYRILPARKPYLQFPVHLDKAKGTVERNGAMKGANSFIMNKYILTENDGITCQNGEKRTITVPEWIGNAGDMEVALVGPDGKAPQPNDPAMYYGHATIVLKETAARLGIWSHGAPGDLTNKSIDNLTKTAAGTDSFPQSIQLHVYADPHASSKNQCDASGYCWTTYYAKGNGYFNEQLKGEYHFEGWGDVPEAQISKVSPVLSGKTTHTVDSTYRANNGSYSMELHFVLDNDSQSTYTNNTGNVSVSVTSAGKWVENTNIKLYVEPRIKLDWDAHRESGPYKGGSCTFIGTMKFDMGSLVLQVK